MQILKSFLKNIFIKADIKTQGTGTHQEHPSNIKQA